MRGAAIAGPVVVLMAAGCAWIKGSGPGGQARSSQADYRDFDRRFAQEVSPIMQTYCLGCHSGEQAASALDLSNFEDAAAIVSGFGVWEHVSDRLASGTMPPTGLPQPTAREREIVLSYIADLRAYEAGRNSGDPGIVLAHRLSNAELNYTILDLTGIDIQPAREFPVDPANEAGFDNTGETLAISPALLTRYLDAARLVSEHIVFNPQGFAFAPHVVVSDVDRDRYVVNRIMDFYRSQPADLADYFLAIWKYENRAALGRPSATLEQMAASEGVAPAYAAMVHGLLADQQAAFPGGPVAELHRRWAEMPRTASNAGDLAAAEQASAALRDWVQATRRPLAWRYVVPRSRPFHVASQIMVMHANRQWAAQRRQLNRAVLVTADQATPTTDPLLIVPTDEGQRAAAIASLERFADVFPDAFLITERTSTWLAANQTGRLLSAGFHSASGYYRDDGPLYDLILDEAGRREIDALWKELDFISNAPVRQLSGFVWFERTDTDFMLSEEFNHLRPEDQDLGSKEKFSNLRDLYMAKVRAAAPNPEYIASADIYFEELGTAIRWTEQARLEAESSHLESLLTFAERAYRRPLTGAEEEGLLQFYAKLRLEDQLSHEDAVRDAVVSVLVSPHFSYRVDLAEGPTSRIGAYDVVPLTGYALASRLSYFLWSSMPDEELLARAAANDLHRPEVLRAQVRRMLRDEKVSRMATEFAMNWLGVRRFDQFNSVGRDRFPMFTNELRQAFFEEPIRFFTAVVREDRPVLDLLFANYTYVNQPLAEHYGMQVPFRDSNEWVRVDNADEYGRGGLLPMAVFLTNYATGLRTSPVKRGHWLASKVLGQHIPAPPPNVPELPSDEADLGAMTLVQLMARHREDPSCASCHATFDHFGIVFEGYGAVGEVRTLDFGGRPVETLTAFPDGTERSGLDGLRRYLEAERQGDFVKNISRRLATYGLGRGLLLSDERLIQDMERALLRNGDRFSVLVETIVTSPQFLMKRMPEGPGSAAPTLSAAR